MRKLYMLIFLLSLQAQLQSQIQITPCQFSWQSVKMPGGFIADYTSPQIEEQPYQGPCMAFALIAALESQYEIDYDLPGRNLDLSEAYLDFTKYQWTNSTLLSVFDNDNAIPESSAGNFSQICQDENGSCFLKTDANGCIDNNLCFFVRDQYQQGNPDPQVDCIQCDPNLKWVRGSHVEKINTEISGIGDLKLKLMTEGPVVLRLNTRNLLDSFYNYSNTVNLTFHAVTIIGWRNASNGIQLHFKDSWPNSAGFKYSKTLDITTLVNNIAIGETENTGMELFQVKNANIVDQRIIATNFPGFSAMDQCPPNTISATISPTIRNVFLNGPNIIRNMPVTVNATLDCAGHQATEWEWDIPSSGSHSPIENACDSRVTFSTYTNANFLQIKVRAKNANGFWSPWTTRVFTVTNDRF